MRTYLLIFFESHPAFSLSGDVSDGMTDHMQYERYEDLIVDRFGIVLEGWPLEGKPRSPSTVGSRPELTVLINAWENGTARFRKLTHEELAAWRSSRSAEPATAPAASQSTPLTHPPTQPEVGATDAGIQTLQAGPLTDVTLTIAPDPGMTVVFTPSTGNVLQVKQRKKRSDAGKKRGPNAKTKHQTGSQEG